MILYPAIDILDGKAVRLVEGRFEDQTVYHDDPLTAAQSWVEAGARFLHVVDLDGARSGSPQSIDHLRRIAGETGVPVQYGGGLRSLPAVRQALRAGAERVIVGTAAFRDIDFLDSVVAAFGPRVLVSVDVRGGHISTAGWTQTTQMPAGDAIRRLGDRGVSSFVYTDVDRDGKLEGPDLDDVRHVAESVRGRFLYSGGIGDPRPPARARRPAPGQPRRRDRRQGALRGPLHDRRGPGGARRAAPRRGLQPDPLRAATGAERSAVGYPIASCRCPPGPAYDRHVPEHEHADVQAPKDAGHRRPRA